MHRASYPGCGITVVIVSSPFMLHKTSYDRISMYSDVALTMRPAGSLVSGGNIQLVPHLFARNSWCCSELHGSCGISFGMDCLTGMVKKARHTTAF